MFHGSNGEEERGLEQGVGQQDDDARGKRTGASHGNGSGHQAQLRHRAIRQDELQVALLQGAIGANDHCY